MSERPVHSSGYTFLQRVKAHRRNILALRQNDFVGHVFVLTSGTALARALTASSVPVLTRLYSPADFGALSVFFSLVTALIVISGFNYEAAIPVPKEDEDALGILGLAFLLLISNVLVVASVTLVFGDSIAQRLGAPRLAPYLLLVPISLLGGGAFTILNSWAIRIGSFTSLTKRRIWQSIAQVVTTIFVPFAKSGPLGLLLGDCIGRAAGSVTLARELRGYARANQLSLSVPRIRRTAITFWRFPTYGLSSVMVHTSLSVLPPLLLTSLFGVESAGAYALVNQILGIGLAVVGLSVAQVFTNKAACLARTDPYALQRLFFRTSAVCAMVAALPMLAVGIDGPLLFSLAFGTRWAQAGAFARILAFPSFVLFVVGPVFPVLTILQRQQWELCIDGLGVSLMVAGMIATSWFGLGPSYAVGVYGLTIVCTYASLYIAAALAIRAHRCSLTPDADTPDRQEVPCAL